MYVSCMLLVCTYILCNMRVMSSMYNCAVIDVVLADMSPYMSLAWWIARHDCLQSVFSGKWTWNNPTPTEQLLIFVCSFVLFIFECDTSAFHRHFRGFFSCSQSQRSIAIGKLALHGNCAKPRLVCRLWLGQVANGKAITGIYLQGRFSLAVCQFDDHTLWAQTIWIEQYCDVWLIKSCNA